MRAGNGERATGNGPMAQVSVVRFVLTAMHGATAIHMFPVPHPPFPVAAA